MTAYVCFDRDIECGRNPASWCASCPQRKPIAAVPNYAYKDWVSTEDLTSHTISALSTEQPTIRMGDLTISKIGITYKGETIDDAGEVHRALLEVMNGKPLPVAAEQAAPKDHDVRQLVNDLRDIAVAFHGTGQLRARIAGAVTQFIGAHSGWKNAAARQATAAAPKEPPALSAVEHAIHNLKQFRAGHTMFPGEAIGIIEGFVAGHTAPVGADLPYRVYEFWSSSRPGEKVRMLAEGRDIADWVKRGDFIRDVTGIAPQIKCMNGLIELQRTQLGSEAWVWVGDGTDYLESMGAGMSVVIRADQLRSLVLTGYEEGLSFARKLPNTPTLEIDDLRCASRPAREPTDELIKIAFQKWFVSDDYIGGGDLVTFAAGFRAAVCGEA